MPHQFLSSKVTEVKESTTKSMSNDLKRIVLTHEQDLLDIERKFKMDERKLREGIQLIYVVKRIESNPTHPVSRPCICLPVFPQ